MKRKLVILVLVILILISAILLLFFKNKPKINTPESAIPKNCVAWFDGCNNCSVKNGKLEACTLMYCETPTTPKCIEYK